ncbi:MAG: ferritin-like domain-containing protein [Chloroflexi bacterium]|nr:ferritin-like domain-containing protein [Chloroflexota bacterium]
MTTRDQEDHEASVRAYWQAEVTRAQMLKAAAVGLGLATIPGGVSAEATSGTGSSVGVGFPFFPAVQGTYTTEALQDVFNILLTFEHFVVTFFAGAVANAGTLGLNTLTKVALQAVLATEQYHADFLTALGARSLTDSYTIPPNLPLTSAAGFLQTMELGETIGTATYMTAAREFAELGQPTLVKYAYQIGATEAEHRVLARGILAVLGQSSAVPPDNKAFETDLFLYVRDVYRLFQQFGFIGGTGTPAAYPGRDAALALAGSIGGGLLQKTPNNATSSVGPADNLTGERS